MLTATGVTVRFGKRVLFEDVNIKFGKGGSLTVNLIKNFCKH